MARAGRASIDAARMRAVEALYIGAPFGDVVDLLLTPFNGHR